MIARSDVSSVTIEERITEDASLEGLLYAARADQIARYGAQASRPVHPDARFLVAFVDGRAAGCGAIQPLDASTGELRRIFVLADYRGRGIARMLLTALEDLARTMRYTKLRLGTGVRQPEAVALYQSCGYVRIQRYGVYLDGPWKLCYEKRLDGPTAHLTPPVAASRRYINVMGHRSL